MTVYQIHSNVLIHLAAQLTALFFEFDLEVTEPSFFQTGAALFTEAQKLPS
jgi:hypothetical protein